MDSLRKIYDVASGRMSGKGAELADTRRHVAERTVRFLDPQTIARRVDRLIRTPLIAKSFDGDVVQELRTQPDIGQLSEKAQLQLERVIGRSDFLPTWFLQRGADLRRTVAKIQAQSPMGKKMLGTGFLVGPGLLLTNAHVLDWSDMGENPLDEIVGSSLAIFDFEDQPDGSPGPTAAFRLAPDRLLLSSPWDAYDYVLIAVEPFSTDGKTSIEQYGFNRLTADLGKVAKGEPVFIIQHPQGGPKQVVLSDNRIVERNDASPYLIYEADTDSGSSGSPVFNRQWEVVALHHSPQIGRDQDGHILARNGGVWDRETGSAQVQFLELNEGIRISKIVNDLDSKRRSIEDNGVQAPHRVTHEGLRSLAEMLKTKHGAEPATLIKPVPAAEKNPQKTPVPAMNFARPD